MTHLKKELEKTIEESVQSAQKTGDLRSFEIPGIRVSVPKHEGQGDLSYPAMALAPYARMKPLSIANVLEKYLSLDNIDFIDRLTVVPPGYLNFFYSDTLIKNLIETVVHSSPTLKDHLQHMLRTAEFEALQFSDSVYESLLASVREQLGSHSGDFLTDLQDIVTRELDNSIIECNRRFQDTIRESVSRLHEANVEIFNIPSVITDTSVSKLFEEQKNNILPQLNTLLQSKLQDTETQVRNDLTNIANRTLRNFEVTVPQMDSLQLNQPFNIPSDYFERMQHRALDSIINHSEEYLRSAVGNGQKVQVEYVSANPSGPITIGHARGAVIGDTMARLLEAAGYEVQREYYYNNAGAQMINLGKSLQLRYLEQLGVDINLPEGYYQGRYLIDLAADMVTEYGDSLRDEEWTIFKDMAESRMFDWIKNSLASINIRHDDFYNETSLFESGKIWSVLEIMRENGHIYEATHWEGADEEEIADVTAKGYKPATWFRSTSFGDEKDRVMVKSDGVPTYTLPDIAYHCDKLERGFDIAVNVLGTDHFSQAQVVKHGIRALGKDPERIHVVFNQMVRAVRWNEESGEYEAVKQSKRAGNFDTLDDLVEMTSADAVRYHMLARNPNSQLDFDVDLVVKQSNENPVYYIQNAYVRCAGIFREAEERGFTDDGADLSFLGEDERQFIRKAMDLVDVIEQAVTDYEPHKIAFFALELAAVFHPIYDEVRVLHSEVPTETAKARLRFYRAAAAVFYRLLRLMGMSAPERM